MINEKNIYLARTHQNKSHNYSYFIFELVLIKIQENTFYVLMAIKKYKYIKLEK